jgi:nucleoside-diphosphate-sugar epimerase
MPLADVLDTVAQLSGASVPVLRRVAQPGDVDATAADLTKARALLGYEPQVSLTEGLRRQWEWLASGAHRSHPVTMEATR